METTNRKLAQKLADEYQAATASRRAEAQVRRVLCDLHRMTSGSSLGSTSLREYLERWIGAKRGTVSEATLVAYEATARENVALLKPAIASARQGTMAVTDKTMCAVRANFRNEGDMAAR